MREGTETEIGPKIDMLGLSRQGQGGRPMKVFVTGATGYIGKALLNALHRAGHTSVGLTREKERAAMTPGPGRQWRLRYTHAE